MESRLVTANRYFGSNCKDYHDYYDKELKPKMHRDAVESISFDSDASGWTKAYINHGRWVVSCPFCNGAEFLWEDQNKFLCSNCWNGANKGKPINIILPIETNEIEEILAKRPLLNRNWLPNETIEDLKRENKDYGMD